MMRFPLSVLLTSLPLEFESAVRTVADLGLTHVDVVAREQRPAGDHEALADSGLIAACAALGRDLPPGCALDAESLPVRRRTLECCRRQLDDAALLGATRAYVVPGHENSPEAMLRFADALALLAEEAADRRIQLCLEPVPGRALASARAALTWLEDRQLVGVRLLLDIGHCLISSEDPARIVHQSGPRLAHVHLDDNNGLDDLHWPLFSGKLTEQVLSSFLNALIETEAAVVLAFEFHPGLSDPVQAVRRGKENLERLMSQESL